MNTSFDKRPRPSSKKIPENAELIDLCSSDEEPPRKRQKSLTPQTDSFGEQPAKPPSETDNLNRTATPNLSQDVTSTTTEHVTVKKSPWKSRPSWQSKSAAPDQLSDNIFAAPNARSGRSLKNIEQDGSRISNGWTNNDNNRLRGLSINHDQPERQSLKNSLDSIRFSPVVISDNTSEDLEQQRQRMVTQFRLGPSEALRFNPNNGNVLSNVSRSPIVVQNSPRIKIVEGDKINDGSRSVDRSLLDPPKFAPGPKQTSSRPNFEIKLPSKPVGGIESSLSPAKLPAPAKSIPLSSSQQHQASRISITVPLTDAAKLKVERKQLQEKLKESAGYAKRHPRQVERLLGLTGFSEEFPADLEEAKFRNAAQPKKRSVDRSRIGLDIARHATSKSLPQLPSTPNFVHPRDQVKAALTARFTESFVPPLTFSNNVNDRRLNGKFQFVSEYILRKGVKANSNPRHSGCTCNGPCGATCSCLSRTFKDEKPKSTRFEQVEQYKRRADGLVVLKDSFIRRYMINANSNTDDHEPAERVEISECNDHCSCGVSCINRVVQRGRTVPLDIFETQRCGFGVRSLANLVRGQFIEVYLGEVITESELIQREEAAEAGSTSYVLSLDWFSSQNAYQVDGENFGSAMRFVNHSCDPNAATFTVLDNKSTKQLHQVAFFTLKDIPAGTEITIDYTPQAAGETYELNMEDEGMEKCYCGAKNCRRMLWRPGKERRSRKKLIARSRD